MHAPFARSDSKPSGPTGFGCVHLNSPFRHGASPVSKTGGGLVPLAPRDHRGTPGLEGEQEDEQEMEWKG